MQLTYLWIPITLLGGKVLAYASNNALIEDIDRLIMSGHKLHLAWTRQGFNIKDQEDSSSNVETTIHTRCLYIGFNQLLNKQYNPGIYEIEDFLKKGFEIQLYSLKENYFMEVTKSYWFIKWHWGVYSAPHLTQLWPLATHAVQQQICPFSCFMPYTLQSLCSPV